MIDNKKAAGEGVPQAALNKLSGHYFNPIPNRLKAAVYRLATWLFALGVFHV